MLQQVNIVLYRRILIFLSLVCVVLIGCNKQSVNSDENNQDLHLLLDSDVVGEYSFVGYTTARCELEITFDKNHTGIAQEKRFLSSRVSLKSMSFEWSVLGDKVLLSGVQASVDSDWDWDINISKTAEFVYKYGMLLPGKGFIDGYAEHAIFDMIDAKINDYIDYTASFDKKTGDILVEISTGLEGVWPEIWYRYGISEGYQDYHFVKPGESNNLSFSIPTECEIFLAALDSFAKMESEGEVLTSDQLQAKQAFEDSFKDFIRQFERGSFDFRVGVEANLIWNENGNSERFRRMFDIEVDDIIVSDGGIQLKQNNLWEIDYNGRMSDGSDIIDVIQTRNVNSGIKYLVSVINEESFNTYKGDLIALFNDELAHSGDYIYSGASQSIEFYPLRHGIWYAFIIALDANGAVSGEYAMKMFTVIEESPTEGFNRWLGKWRVSDGSITYDITVTSVEANYVYRVDGWEVFPGAWEQMTQEYIETFYDQGEMYFVSQYIQNYTDSELGYVEELFLGLVDYDGPLIITDEWLDLAKASFGGDGNPTITPCRVSVITESGEYETDIQCMKYIYKNKNDYYEYNGQVLSFPCSISPVLGTANASCLAHRGHASSVRPLRAKRFIGKADSGSRRTAKPKVVRQEF